MNHTARTILATAALVAALSACGDPMQATDAAPAPAPVVWEPGYVHATYAPPAPVVIAEPAPVVEVPPVTAVVPEPAPVAEQPAAQPARTYQPASATPAAQPQPAPVAAPAPAPAPEPAPVAPVAEHAPEYIPDHDDAAGPDDAQLCADGFSECPSNGSREG